MAVEIKWGDDVDKFTSEEIQVWLDVNQMIAHQSLVAGDHKLWQTLTAYRNYLGGKGFKKETALAGKARIRQEVLGGYKPEE